MRLVQCICGNKYRRRHCNDTVAILNITSLVQRHCGKCKNIKQLTQRHSGNVKHVATMAYVKHKEIVAMSLRKCKTKILLQRHCDSVKQRYYCNATAAVLSKDIIASPLPLCKTKILLQRNCDRVKQRYYYNVTAAV